MVVLIKRAPAARGFRPTAARFTIALLLVFSYSCAAKSDPKVREEHVQFRSGDVTLDGTLILPHGAGKHPAVVIFHGSGTEYRNLTMARWFAAHGVAALTYDKRGVGKSGGDYREIPFMDLTADGLAGLAMLKSRPSIDRKQIGVWGISQGGWLGPLAATQSHDVAFVIAVSGPGVSPGEQMIFYFENQLRQKGLSGDELSEASALRRQIWNCLSTGAACDAARTAVKSAKSKSFYATLAAQDDHLFETFDNAEDEREDRWFRAEMNYDPTVALRKLSVPALFIFGDQDRLVPVARSVQIIRDTMAASGHRDVTIKVFAGADHVIRVRGADGISGFAPQYLETMQDWLRAHTHAQQ